MADKELLDIKDIKSEFEKLAKKQDLIEKGFYAISMDYSHYIDKRGF